MVAPEHPSRAGSTALYRALECCLSAQEYGVLHRVLRERSPIGTGHIAPTPEAYEQALVGSNRRLTARIRAFIRVFIAIQAAQKLLDALKDALARGLKGRAIR